VRPDIVVLWLTEGVFPIVSALGPFEVEAILQEHPAVSDVAVVASPCPKRGEVVKAFVVLTDAAKYEEPARVIKQLQDHCKKEAAPYKYPRRVQFVDADFFPRTSSGKIQRAQLRKIEQKHYAMYPKL
jgi:medium-chain acyl-CoA synthetase